MCGKGNFSFCDAIPIFQNLLYVTNYNRLLPLTRMHIHYDTVARLLICRTPDELTRMIGTLLSSFGASNWIYAVELDAPGAPRYWLGGYPEQWVAHYVAQGYPEIDPVVQHAKGHVVPYLWPDYRRLPHDETALKDPVNRLFIEAHDYGLNGGITIPVHGLGVKWGLVSLSFARVRDMIEANKQMESLFLLCHQIHEAGLRLMMASASSPLPGELTPTELECLKLAAQGLTSDEIADRLNKKKRRITALFQSIVEKLGVKSRQAAVATAITQKIIQL